MSKIEIFASSFAGGFLKAKPLSFWQKVREAQVRVKRNPALQHQKKPKASCADFADKQRRMNTDFVVFSRLNS
jgi:hypothetical protein